VQIQPTRVVIRVFMLVAGECRRRLISGTGSRVGSNFSSSVVRSDAFSLNIDDGGFAARVADFREGIA